VKLLRHKYETMDSLHQFIQQQIPHDANILIQIFCGTGNIEQMRSILAVLTRKLPSAVIIGASTAGEIVQGTMQENTIQIAFSIFEHTNIRSIYYPKADFDTGVQMAKEFVHSDTKALIAFSETLHNDSELFLRGFSSIEQKIPVAGGNAGDNFEFSRTCIIHQDTIYFDGIVVCAIDGEFLHVSTNSSFEWTPIGKEMVVTKVEDNILYELDGIPIEAVYEHNFGEEISLDFPSSIAAFPLVRSERGMAVARCVIAKAKDGGFVYAGHFQEGEKVRFSIGTVEAILDNVEYLYREIVSHPAEATFVYSCSARKKFLQKHLNYEFALIEKAVPSIGFFTYGEFFHTQNHNELLNITTTTLTLSETDKIPDGPLVSAEERPGNSILKSLTYFINVSQKTLHENIAQLDQYKQILDKSSIVSKTDKHGIITYVNEEFCRVSGYTKEELLGYSHNIVRHPDNDPTIFKSMWESLQEKKTWYGTIKNLTKRGQTYYVKSVIMPILNDQGDIMEYIAARTNVTELIEQEKIIERQFRDDLTGLHNRVALLYELSSNAKEEASLILINIDRFSDINDYFGYEIGDQILLALSAKLKEKHTKVYRLSGDEFALLCEHDLNQESKEEITEIITNLEDCEYGTDEGEISIFVSCGVAYGTKDEIYKLSHMALKENQKSNLLITFYNEDDNLKKKIKNNIKIISMINEGLKNDRFIPFFQGIVDNETQEIVKFESLIRLKTKEGEIITPFFFLEHAKKAKRYIHLTEVMIRKTFACFSDLPYQFSINLSLQDIESEQVVNTLCEKLEYYKCGERVVLEIVESEGIANFELISNFITRVKKHHCKIAIDDFGTGYSNFIYLTKLDIDFIKIDGSLIKGIESDPTQRKTVESIVHFAKKLGIKTIGEFVENRAIYEILKELGVDYSQGYYFSKPQENLPQTP
jgi:c-di-GMP phosphodiesterase